MKALFSGIIFILLIGFQKIHGQSYFYGFESWQHYDLYEEPDDFLTSNSLCFLNFATTNVTRIPGNVAYAARIRNYPFTGTNALLPGFVGNFDITKYPFGGTPVEDLPDSIIAHLNLDIMPGDTGLFLVIFKKAGIPISNNIYGLVSSSNGKIRSALPVQKAPIKPDSVLFLISSGSFQNPFAGSAVEIDALEFKFQNSQISNNSFESWKLLSFEEPDEWSTPNFYTALFQFPDVIERSFDAFKGLYSMLIRNVFVDRYGFQQFYGSSFLGEAGTYIPLSLPFAEQEFEFGMHYKYLVDSPDTAWVVLRPSYFDFQMSKRRHLEPISIRLLPSDKFEKVIKKIALVKKPDSLNIELYAGNYYRGMPDSLQGIPKESSRLLLDELYLKSDLGTSNDNSEPNPNLNIKVYLDNKNGLVIDTQTDKEEKIRLQLFSTTGVLINQKNLSIVGKTKVELNMKEYQRGLYLIHLQSSNNAQIVKILK